MNINNRENRFDCPSSLSSTSSIPKTKPTNVQVLGGVNGSEGVEVRGVTGELVRNELIVAVKEFRHIQIVAAFGRRLGRAVFGKGSFSETKEFLNVQGIYRRKSQKRDSSSSSKLHGRTVN
jgi:hypothetical protein